MAINGPTIFAGTVTHAGAPVMGIYTSTNSGSTWTAANNGLPTNAGVYALAISGTNIFAGTYFNAYLSTNNGASWSTANNGLPSPPAINALAVSGTSVFAGTSTGIFLTSNNGSSWTAMNNGLPANPVVISLATSGSAIYAGIYAPNGGLYLSTNNGNSWTQANNGLTDTTVRSLAISGGNVFAGTHNGVFLSTNNGASWSAFNSGLPANTIVSSMAISGTHIFAGTGGSGVWKRPLSEVATEISEMDLDNSITIFPNPFSTQTTLKADFIFKDATLRIYNSFGQEVRQIKNLSGQTTQLHRDNLPVGVYFLLLTQENKTIASTRLIITD
jgi:ligand-binding sensor domain-containing protein